MEFIKIIFYFLFILIIYNFFKKNETEKNQLEGFINKLKLDESQNIRFISVSESGIYNPSETYDFNVKKVQDEGVLKIEIDISNTDWIEFTNQDNCSPSQPLSPIKKRRFNIQDIDDNIFHFENCPISGENDKYLKAIQLLDRNNNIIKNSAERIRNYIYNQFFTEEIDATRSDGTLDYCNPDPCIPNGTCRYGTCICNPGFKGDNCQEEDNVINTCQGGNFGSNCEYEASQECKTSYCLRNSSQNPEFNPTCRGEQLECTGPGPRENCIKPDDWDTFGNTLNNSPECIHCSSEIGVSGYDGCGKNGTCNTDNTGCDCNAGFTGDYCQNLL